MAGTFKDATGREFEVSISLGSLSRIKSAGGPDFSKSALTSGEKEETARNLAGFFADPIRQVEAMVPALKESLAKHSIEAEELFDALNGKATSEAVKTFGDAVEEFYAAIGETAVVQLIQKARAIAAGTDALLAERIKNVDTEAILTEAAAKFTEGA